MEHLSQNLDWVTVRASCTVECVFQELREEIKSDITTRNKLLTGLQKEDSISFHLKPDSENSFAVVRNGLNIVSRTTFKCERSAIQAFNGAGVQIIEARLTLNDQGECRLVVDGCELTRWQFRKRTLQSLFFEF